MTRILPAAAAAVAAAAALFAQPAAAVQLEISFTNHSGAGGLYLTPLLAVFHDGNYRSFVENEPASAGLEALAEDGNPGPELADSAAGFQTGLVTAPGGFAGAPVLDPGETARLVLDIDPTGGRWFSFLSMVIPSNDNFIGNDDPFAIEVFDAAGAFLDPARIDILGANIWDAGTEVDQPDGSGAAFATTGGTSPDEDGVVHLDGDLSGLLGIIRASGGPVTEVPGAADLFASIEIRALDAQVPVPAAGPLALAGIGALGLLSRRRRRAAA